ncbi:hypothetical protein CBOM_02232 [Ceraceosorus bombacis]|uniref:Uncharacterized protein n=1 Tax=Ceraceosorus bombacis TaxID=401625 RepID=A0A0P1BE62_9BASI|nr:hypothetical protein CBOM_02232 [Ceraceosorus bombacis]
MAGKDQVGLGQVLAHPELASQDKTLHKFCLNWLYVDRRMQKFLVRHPTLPTVEISWEMQGGAADQAGPLPSKTIQLPTDVVWNTLLVLKKMGWYMMHSTNLEMRPIPAQLELGHVTQTREGRRLIGVACRGAEKHVRTDQIVHNV